MITENFTLTAALAKGWEKAKEHWIVFIGTYLAFFLIAMVFQLLRGDPLTNWWYGLVEVVYWIFSILFNMGYTKMTLNALDGEELEFNVFQKTANRFLPYIGTIILLTVGTLIGLGLLIVPGIWFICRFGFAATLVIDRKELSVISAMQESYRLTEGKVWSMIKLWLLMVLIIIVGILCLVVGVLFAHVVVALTYVAAMRLLQQERSNDLNQSV